MDPKLQTEVIYMTCTDVHEKSVPNSAAIPRTSSGCQYDFVILYARVDKPLFEKFFSTLEHTYNLTGFHKKRDIKPGVLKSRHLVKVLEKSKFIIELISKQSFEDKSFQRLRSVAHEVECKQGEREHSEVLPIFLDIPRDEQRSFTTTVGKKYVDNEIFWKELIEYMLGLTSPASPNLPRSRSILGSCSSDVKNNNSVLEEDSNKVKYRRKHKVFRGLFQGSEKKTLPAKAPRRKRHSKKKGKKRKSKKGLKSLRKLLLCVPARSKADYDSSSPTANGEPMSPFPKPQSTARQDSLEGEHIGTPRSEISRA